MAYVLDDLVRHNIWATKELLAFCRGLDEETLNATVPGTYGTVIGTLWHEIASEASYLYRLTGAWPEFPWELEKSVPIPVLEERAAELARVWEALLAAGDLNTERFGEARGDEDQMFDVRAGIFLTQALHHANEHRAQILTIIGAQGLEAPELSGWEFALATGRMAPKRTQADG
jgi:uncharacterized damage-inducible protein DinB